MARRPVVIRRGKGDLPGWPNEKVVAIILPPPHTGKTIPPIRKRRQPNTK